MGVHYLQETGPSQGTPCRRLSLIKKGRRGTLSTAHLLILGGKIAIIHSSFIQLIKFYTIVLLPIVLRPSMYHCNLVSLSSLSSSKISSASQRVISKNEIAIKSWKRPSSCGILIFSYLYYLALSVCYWIMLLITKFEDLSIFSYQLMIAEAFRAYIHWLTPNS